MVTGSVGVAGTASPGGASQTGGGMTVGEFVSCLNPLQYLPVVGTIYRAVTGDTIPEPVREAGSLVVSGLTGGPIGVALSAGVDLAERAVGFDEEQFGQRVLGWLGIGGRAASGHHGTVTVTPAAVPQGAAAATTSVASSGAAGTAAGASSPGAPAMATAFSKAELATVAPSSGADGLNGLELGRLAAAGGAYRQALSLG